MHVKYLKFLTAGTLTAFLGLTLNVSADINDSDVETYSSVYNKSDKDYFPISVECDPNYDYSHDGFIDYNSICTTCCDKPCFCFSSDWLFWDVCQENTDIAVTDSTIQPSNILADGETEFFDFDYKYGFRLAGTYRLPYSCWALELRYTRFHPTFSQSFDPSVGGQLLPTTIAAPISSDNTDAHADATIRLRYDLYDVLVAKTYTPNASLSVRPYGGFRAMWFRERVETGYGVPGAPPDFTGLWRVDFPTYGVTLGAEGKYHICSGISAIGHWGASVTGGQVEHHNQWSGLVAVTPQTETREHCQVVGGWDASLGLSYDSSFCGYPYFVAVGYEVQDWWNMPQRPRFVNTATYAHFLPDDNSRVTFHGFFLRSGCSF